MPWLKVEGCTDFQGINWIHPWFQKRIADLVVHTRNNFSGVTYLVVFGSVTSNRCTEDSDIDLLVGGDPNGEFYEPLCDDTPYDVIWAKFLPADSELWNEICKEGVVVYGPIHA